MLGLALLLAACGAGHGNEGQRRGKLEVVTTSTTADRDELYRIFVVAFGAAPGVTYMNQMLESVAAGLSTHQILDIFTTKPQFLDTYPLTLTPQEFARKLVDAVVGSSATEATRAEAAADIVAALSPPIGWTRSEVILATLRNLAGMPQSDPKWGAAAKKLALQVLYARHFTETMQVDTLDPVQLRAVVQPVTQDSSVNEAELTQLILKAVQAAGTGGRDLDPPDRQVVTFLPSEADIPNPERGFYSAGGVDFLFAWDAAALRAARSAGRRLLMARVQLDDWRDSDLPAWVLTTLDQRLTQVRSSGMKVTLLFNYDFSEQGRDAAVQRIRGHLQQLKPVLAAHAAVIPFMRAGFIGAWGEWHSSLSGHSCTAEPGTPACAAAEANRLFVRDALLENVPETTQIGIRFPADLMRWYPDPLQQRRLGLHNDCFLAGPSDSGTYTEWGQREYVQALSERAAFGGETCVEAELPLRDNCADILAEGRQYHLAWLNADYAPEVIAGWKAQGCLAQVSAFMGYRLQLDAVTHAAEVARGASLEVGIDLRNVGWARFFTPRRLVVTLRHRDTGATLSGAAGDLRELPAQASFSSRLRVSLPVPVQAELGDYDVWLSVPDIFAATEGDPRFSVRFANADRADGSQVWSSSLGRFRTGSTVRVR